ncbi:hypothetical protein [Vibrio aerogenes]|uniref:hypothetical protein n=1 Tax=Vibrio aerogenes TaxID=92172 RepID=UPI0011148BAE|nr:hypothetical protein [Vibrio aerogenes]
MPVLFDKISVLPEAETFPALLRQFMKLGNLTQSQFCQLSEQRGFHPFDDRNLKSWINKGSFPNPGAKRTILYIFSQVCETEEIAKAWCDKYRQFELENLDQKANRRRQSRKTSKADESPESTNADESAMTDDSSGSKSVLFSRAPLYEWCVTHQFHLIIGLFFIFIILFTSSFLGENKPVIINNNIHLDNQQNQQTNTLNMGQDESADFQHTPVSEPYLQPQKTVFPASRSVVSPHVTPVHPSTSSPAFPPVSSQSLPAAEKAHATPEKVKNAPQEDEETFEPSSYVDLKQGLKLDVYVFKGKNRDLMYSFDKYLVGSLTYHKGGLFTYADHTLNPGVYQATSGRDSGLYYHGYIFFSSPGMYVFSLDFNSGEPGVMQATKKCRVTLNFNHRERLNDTVRLLLSQHGKGVFTTSVKGGLNDFSLWFSCNHLLNLPLWNVKHIYQKTTVAVKVRKLSESKAALLNADQLFYSP